MQKRVNSSAKSPYKPPKPIPKPNLEDEKDEFSDKSKQITELTLSPTLSQKMSQIEKEEAVEQIEKIIGMKPVSLESVKNSPGSNLGIPTPDLAVFGEEKHEEIKQNEKEIKVTEEIKETPKRKFNFEDSSTDDDTLSFNTQPDAKEDEDEEEKKREEEKQRKEAEKKAAEEKKKKAAEERKKKAEEKKRKAEERKKAAEEKKRLKEEEQKKKAEKEAEKNAEENKGEEKEQKEETTVVKKTRGRPKKSTAEKTKKKGPLLKNKEFRKDSNEGKKKDGLERAITTKQIVVEDDTSPVTIKVESVGREYVHLSGKGTILYREKRYAIEEPSKKDEEYIRLYAAPNTEITFENPYEESLRFLEIVFD